MQQTADPVTHFGGQTLDAVTPFDLQLFAEDTSGDGDQSADKTEPNKIADKEATVTKAYADSLRNETAKERKARLEVEAERDELRKFKDDAEKAELEKKGEVEKLLERERKERAADKKQSEEKIAAVTRRVIMSEARRLAKEAGLIDLDDIKSLDFSDLRVDDDDSVPGLADLIAQLKESKPHYFRAAAEDKDKNKDRKIVRPSEKEDDGKDGTNWSNKSAAELSKDLRSRYGVQV